MNGTTNDAMTDGIVDAPCDGAGDGAGGVKTGDARIRVAVVDDHEMFRAGVTATLRTEFDIVGQGADVDGSIAMIAATKPGVIGQNVCPAV